MDRTKNLRAVRNAGKRYGLGCDGIDGAFDDSEVVVGKKIVVAPCLAVIRYWPDTSEDVENARRRCWSIVEEKL